MLCDSESEHCVKKPSKEDRVFVQGSFMPLSDPKERFKRLTQTDFVLNKSKPLSESKKACAVGRLDRMEERGWISILISNALTNANVFECTRVTPGFCAISNLEEWEGSPQWHWPPHSFMFHICRDCKQSVMYTQMHKHIPTWLWLHVSGLILRRLHELRDTITHPESLQAALGQEAHHQSLQSQVNGRRSPRDEEKGLKEEQQTRGLLWTRKQTHICDSGNSDRLCMTEEKMHTHTHNWESYSDRQSCHPWLPFCHSDMDRLRPYERLCSPKPCLGAGVRKMRQLLLIRGHNQMWKLSCTLTGSREAKVLPAVILMPFFSRLHEKWRGWGCVCAEWETH